MTPRQPPRLFIPPIQAFLWFGAGWLVHRAAGVTGIHRPFYLSFAGWVFIVTGLGLANWAVHLFRRAGTSEKPWLHPKAFVVRGPYVLTRNPMYVGMTLVLLGIAMLKSSPVLLLAPIGFMASVSLTWIRYEEFVLARKFGKPYLAYNSRVSRWL